MPDEAKKIDTADQQKKLERVLMSQGYPRDVWPHELAQLSDEAKTELAACIDADGLVKRGTGKKLTAWKIKHAERVRDAAAQKAAAPAKETGENAKG